MTELVVGLLLDAIEVEGAKRSNMPRSEDDEVERKSND
jgi:hypothetical protein